MRETLLNKISEDILNSNNKKPSITIIEDRVNEYFDIMEDVVRNIYELVGPEQIEVPLFSLCYLIKEGQGSFGFSDEEYVTSTENLLKSVNKKFHVNYTI